MLPPASEPVPAGSMTVPAPRATTAARVVDRAWVGELDRVLEQLAGEIRRDLRREPDTGDLLLAFLGAPDTVAGRVLRELGAEPDALSGIVERVRTRMLAEDELARQIQELAQAREQAAEDLARLRADEHKLRVQAEARTALTPEALQMIRQHLGLRDMSSENAPRPPLAP
jgi:DNA repair ATPase RecN